MSRTTTTARPGSTPSGSTSPSTRRALARAAATTATLAAAGLLAAGTASAHVVADGTDTSQGGYGVVTLRVPTESDTSPTTALSVTLPPGAGITSVRTTPVPGWTSAVTEGAGVTPTAITWTADPGQGVPPGQFQQFAFSAGPLPTAATLELPTVQTYGDGSSVRWDEATPASGEEPEHPVPTLELTAASTEEGAATTTTAPTAEAGVSAAAAQTTTAAAPASDDTARWLGGAGLLLGAVGLVAGVGALARSRRSA